MLVISISFWFIQGSRTYLNTEESLTHVIQAQEAIANDVPVPAPTKKD